MIAWLRDAYALEQQAIQILSMQLRRLRGYPALGARLREHLDETRGQARMVRDCLQRYGAGTSLVKTGLGVAMGNVMTIGTALTEDEVVKNAVADYAFESLEIATYTCLIAAAEEAGDAETRRACETILEQEQRMARWLEQHLAGIAQGYLRHTGDFPAAVAL